MRKFLSLPVFAILVAFQAPYDGDPSMWGNGQVVDEAGAPLSDVIVLRHDFAEAFHGGAHCNHFVIARTDDHGRFFMAPRLSISATNRKQLIAYRAGYLLTGVSDTGFRVSMSKDNRSNVERLAYLDNMSIAARCFFEPSERIMELLQKMIDEASQLAREDEKAMKVVRGMKSVLETERDRVRASRANQEER